VTPSISRVPRGIASVLGGMSVFITRARGVASERTWTQLTPAPRRFALHVTRPSGKSESSWRRHGMAQCGRFVPFAPAANSSFSRPSSAAFPRFRRRASSRSPGWRWLPVGVTPAPVPGGAEGLRSSGEPLFTRWTSSPHPAETGRELAWPHADRAESGALAPGVRRRSQDVTSALPRAVCTTPVEVT
jgi:hypothetical protein